jgi:UDP-N-acetylglucosamine transferase subunit ALG13
LPTPQPKNILLAPLDWGLGHTTRCMPILSYLLELGHNPIFAGNDDQASIIKSTFGKKIKTVKLDGYNVRYSPVNRFFQAGLMGQAPGLIKKIKQEHSWLADNAGPLGVDGIISDNRYGLYHPSVPSVILTHQLQIRTGLGRVADNLVQQLHYKYLNKFGATWVVDSAVSPGLGGTLSHSVRMPADYQYLGHLSRFGDEKCSSSRSADAATLILLSGPEPQRSILSDLLWHQAKNINGNFIFSEGSSSAQQRNDIPGHITYYQRLEWAQLGAVLNDAGLVISRSGYSTIMDLVALQKKAVLIPTPGQTEQLYLAKMLHAQGRFFSASQQGFNLEKAMIAAKSLANMPETKPDSFGLFRAVMDKWLSTL